MSSKYFNEVPCDCLKRFNTASKSAKCSKSVVPKKLVSSRYYLNKSDKDHSYSTGSIERSKKYNNNRKTAQSDLICSTKVPTRQPLDYCKNCGDHYDKNKKQDTETRSSNEQSTSDGNIKNKNTKVSKVGTKLLKRRTEPISNAATTKPNGIKQYYKNKNFKSTDSMAHDVQSRKNPLGTIKEVTEVPLASEAGVIIRDIHPDTEEEIGCFDTNDFDNISNLKKFRHENYFECHSAKSRIDSKPTAPSLRDHECSYRFYLNDRLFPVPLHTDHHKNVRCVECKLPIDLKHNRDDTKPSGVIQAKVRINDEAQDMILMLPVKDNLIIREKRRELKAEKETLYFGVIRLDNYGNSIFNSTLPSDSLALKYQKGYREIKSNDDYRYNGVDKDDVIIV